MNAGINIVYPINGDHYRAVDERGGSVSTYFTAGFSTTCNGGGFDVEWGFNEDLLGRGTFYDQMSTQFVWKLPEGRHTFWVEAKEYEKKVVEFFIG